MRVLVTGATGFIGQHLVIHLRRAGHETILLVRELYGMGQPLPPPLASIREELVLVYADVRNFRLCSRAVGEAQPQIIVHLAATGVTDPYIPVETALRHNVTGTVNLARAAFEKTRTTQRLIVARTPGETAPTNPYQASKAAAWKFCQMYARQRQWSINGAVIFQAYGPGQPANTLVPTAFAAALQGKDLPMTEGTQERDWIYIDDAVAGLATLATMGIEAGESIDLGTGNATTVLDVVNQIYGLVGKGGQPLAGSLSSRPGEEHRQVARAAETHDRMGWVAGIRLSEGLRRTLAAQQVDL